MLGIVLLLFELVLIARMVVDWIGVLPRWVPKPVRFGSISIDLAFTAVFVAVIVLALVHLVPAAYRTDVLAHRGPAALKTELEVCLGSRVKCQEHHKPSLTR
ncbi:MAG: hypothetical protein JWR37_441 [Mycobacterium sp.]|nr:hypothetical protein [Mycobacterium sp.]